ncbi:molybdopterin molybdotransferase MoeA [Halococcus hamelinensis]|uniref:Molybdenum cofactor synthesis domain-containing protein n=2 Tax=Halococcus hamelinensis TaxID=332168 RepID=M0LYE1_9EURY|nr:molybdopterin molybdotransferase MoeA [Halococcus hamelinensis]EMA38193.1 molybdenum cofactor synthesis domain-containing protein [Halococcus hamelinensis 100A6]
MPGAETVTRSTAVDRLLEHRAGFLGALSSEPVGPAESAGRTLAEDLRSPRDVPPTDYATMDGYAVATDDDGARTVVGSVAPEDSPPRIDPGEAVEVATGAPLPERADAVVPRENATVTDDQLADPRLASGTNVIRRGTTTSADERLFAAGDRLAPRHAALLADVGIESVRVRRRPSVAIVATGTEIHEGRQPDRDSDFLAGLVRRWGGEPSAPKTVPDDLEAVESAITDAAASYDAVLTTGGTSVGAADHVSGVLADHDLLFPGVALRPGRPVTAALVNDTPVIGLPGKPIAAHTAAVLVVRALFVGRAAIPTTTVELARRVAVPDDGIEYAVPVVVEAGNEGREAMPLGHVDSSLPLYEERFAPGLVAASTRATLADGFVLTDASLESGETTEVVPYPVVE